MEHVQELARPQRFADEMSLEHEAITPTVDAIIVIGEPNLVGRVSGA